MYRAPTPARAQTEVVLLNPRTDRNVGHYKGKPKAKERKCRTPYKPKGAATATASPEGVSYRTMLA
jgi:hypothetical protein